MNIDGVQNEVSFKLEENSEFLFVKRGCHVSLFTKCAHTFSLKLRTNNEKVGSRKRMIVWRHYQLLEICTQLYADPSDSDKNCTTSDNV